MNRNVHVFIKNVFIKNVIENENIFIKNVNTFTTTRTVKKYYILSRTQMCVASCNTGR